MEKLSGMPSSNHVLIVDSSREAISEIIADISILDIEAEFRVALNSGHALLHLKHLHLEKKIEHIDKILVIVNMHTPIVDGFHLLENLKSDESLDLNKIKVMIFEDNLTPWNMEDIEELGYYEYISIPLEKQNDIEKIREYLGGSGFNSILLDKTNSKQEQKIKRNPNSYKGATRV